MTRWEPEGSRSLRAEVRAVEEGHLCRYDRGRQVFLVKSDSSTRTYELRALGRNGLLVVTCTCPWGTVAPPAPGTTECKHQALVARRFERLGLARFEGGRWVLTEKVEKVLDNAGQV